MLSTRSHSISISSRWEVLKLRGTVDWIGKVLGVSLDLCRTWHRNDTHFRRDFNGDQPFLKVWRYLFRRRRRSSSGDGQVRWNFNWFSIQSGQPWSSWAGKDRGVGVEGVINGFFRMRQSSSQPNFDWPIPEWLCKKEGGRCYGSRLKWTLQLLLVLNPVGTICIISVSFP